MELQPYKAATTEQSICTVSIGEINSRQLQKWLQLKNKLRYGATIFSIALAMNRKIDYWVSFSFTHPLSLHLKAKFMKKIDRIQSF